MEKTVYSTQIAPQIHSSTDIPPAINKLPDDILLHILSLVIQPSYKPGQLINRAELLENAFLTRDVSLTCKLFYTLIGQLKKLVFLDRISVLGHSAFLSSSIRPLNFYVYSQAFSSYEKANSYYTQSFQELLEKTQTLFPTRLDIGPDAQMGIIQRINSLHIYNLIIFNINAPYAPVSEIDNETIKTLMSTHSDAIHNLFTDCEFLTLLLRTSSFVPKVFVELIFATARENQSLFQNTLELAARFSHPEVVCFMVSHNSTLPIKRRFVISKMTPSASSSTPRCLSGPLLPTQQTLSALPPKKSSYNVHSTNFQASVTGLYENNIDTLIKDFTFCCTESNQETEANDRAILTIRALLTFANQLHVGQWVQLLRLCKGKREEPLLKQLLEALVVSYPLLRAKEEIDMQGLHTIFERIVFDAILWKNAALIGMLKKVLPQDILVRSVDAIKAYFAKDPTFAVIFPPFELFIAEHVLS